MFVMSGSHVPVSQMQTPAHQDEITITVLAPVTLQKMVDPCVPSL